MSHVKLNALIERLGEFQKNYPGTHTEIVLLEAKMTLVDYLQLLEDINMLEKKCSSGWSYKRCFQYILEMARRVQ